MKICVYGAGAIGSWLGGRLFKAGYNTTLITRGPHLEAIQQQGLKFIEAESKPEILQIPASLNGADIGPQDLIFVTLKAHSIPQVVTEIDSLMHENTVVITAVNGVPWWFFYRLDPEIPERPVYSVDPNGELWNRITPARTLGCVLYPSANLPSPGVVEHLSGDQLPIGEPDGSESERAELISSILTKAGCRSPARRRLHNEIWLKLLGNVAFNPLSVMLNETLDKLATEEQSRKTAGELMEECMQVGRHYKLRIGMTIEKRMQGAANVGPHKTSMLQDYLRGKPLEIGSILDAVIELADLGQIKVPALSNMRKALLDKLENEGIATA